MADSGALVINEWDPSTMPSDATILIVGKRHTGKSVLTRDLLYQMRKRLDVVVGMNPTEIGNRNLEFCIPKSMIFHSFNGQKLRHILDWQRRAVANNKAKKIGLVMDDCMAEMDEKGNKKKVMNGGDIEAVFKLGRHYKLFYINAMQYIKDAPPSIRGNVDLLFVFNTNSGTEREKLWKEYFAMFKTYRDFCSVFESCAQGYDCIVLDSRKASVSPSECIFYYRAKVHQKPFRVGRSIFWRLDEYYYQDRSDYTMDPSKVIGYDFEAGKEEKKNKKEPLVVHRRVGKPTDLPT
jgi:hypothetical protein